MWGIRGNESAGGPSEIIICRKRSKETNFHSSNTPQRISRDSLVMKSLIPECSASEGAPKVDMGLRCHATSHVLHESLKEEQNTILVGCLDLPMCHEKTKFAIST